MGGEHHHIRKMSGLCVRCGKVPPKLGVLSCQSCVERAAKVSQKRIRNYAAKGLCKTCGEECAPNRRSCQGCLDKAGKNSLAHRRDRRRQVLEAYGPPYCRCCGEDNQSSLEVDHINNDGAAHRQKVSAPYFYRWLIENNFPAGFQLLCRTCNMSKHRNGGVCEHQTQYEQIVKWPGGATCR